MPGYRCLFFTADNHITEPVEFEADTDRLAIIEGRARYAESENRDGFEVWQLSRLVYQKDRLRCLPEPPSHRR